MEWKSVEKDGLPAIGEAVLLFSNGVVQQAVYYLDSQDHDLYSTHFWASDDSRLLEEAIDIKNTDQWFYVHQIPKPNTQ